MVGQSHILTASVENWPGKSHSRMSVDLFDVSNKPCEPAGRAAGAPQGCQAAPRSRSLTGRVRLEWRHTTRGAGKCCRQVSYRENGIRAQKNCRCTQVPVPHGAVINRWHCIYIYIVYMLYIYKIHYIKIQCPLLITASSGTGTCVQRQFFCARMSFTL